MTNFTNRDLLLMYLVRDQKRSIDVERETILAERTRLETIFGKDALEQETYREYTHNFQELVESLQKENLMRQLKPLFKPILWADKLATKEDPDGKECDFELIDVVTGVFAETELSL